MDVCECDKSRGQQQVNALLSSTLVIQREVQNLGVLISHPIQLRHLTEFASKIEVLSDMLRYYSGKACNYREISPPLEEFLMPFVLHSRQEVQRERQAKFRAKVKRQQQILSLLKHKLTMQEVCDKRKAALERNLCHHEREQHAGAPCTCQTNDIAEDEIDCQ